MHRIDESRSAMFKTLSRELIFLVMYFEGAEEYNLKVADTEYTPHHEKNGMATKGAWPVSLLPSRVQKRILRGWKWRKVLRAHLSEHGQGVSLEGAPGNRRSVGEQRKVDPHSLEEIKL